MNEITRRSVLEAVRKAGWNSANRQDIVFNMTVEECYWTNIMLDFGIDLKITKLEEWQKSHPEDFDSDGFLLDDNIDIMISEEVKKTMEENIDSSPRLKLDSDWPLFLEQYINGEVDEHGQRQAKQLLLEGLR